MVFLRLYLVAIVATILTNAAAAATPAPLSKGTRAYSSCDLAGRKVSDLYSFYLGYHGSLPQTLTINFHDQLAKLWEMKVKRTGDNPTAKRMRDTALASYATSRAMHIPLDAYIAHADRESQATYKALDWQKVGALYFAGANGKVNQRKLTLLKNVVGLIDGKDLVAYALTELMPTKDGAMNAEVLDCLLRNAGREFVEYIPAVYDDKTSFGPYQFTEYAVYDTGSSQRGASIANLALPSQSRIPGSVIFLKGDQHFRAAYLNAVNNLAYLIRFLTPQQVAALETGWRSKNTDILAYIAVAHHGPSYAKIAGARWLIANAKLPFAAYTAGAYRTYAQKTAANWRALQ
jgi:hypothetical protein